MLHRLTAVTLMFVASSATDDVNCSKMKVKELRVFLADRGLKCEGCAEKADFVAMCEANEFAPLVEKEAPKEAPKGDAKKESIEDILAGMKGMPGMEGIKMFSADDLKNMDYEQMGNAFGGGGGYKKPTRAENKERLETFYKRYGLEDKLEGVDAALDKWKGREERMFAALNKKYASEIKAYWDKEGAKEEL